MLVSITTYSPKTSDSPEMREHLSPWNKLHHHVEIGVILKNKFTKMSDIFVDGLGFMHSIATSEQSNAHKI